ncbi:hypothetical protein MKEN_01275400 [Mycena kentingensis (nom. inval.)]|nr:hypothetical protein MKEN_01275400 [Mycena kentingensis (nom. inval.)]
MHLPVFLDPPAISGSPEPNLHIGLDIDASSTATAAAAARTVISGTTSFNPKTSAVIVALSFLVLSLWAIAFCLFAPKHWFTRTKKKRVGLGLGVGFGYTGLSQSELEELQRRDEERAERSFARLSPTPPSLQEIEPLSPLEKKADVEAYYFEPAPAYEERAY